MKSHVLHSYDVLKLSELLNVSHIRKYSTTDNHVKCSVSVAKYTPVIFTSWICDSFYSLTQITQSQTTSRATMENRRVDRGKFILFFYSVFFFKSANIFLTCLTWNNFETFEGLISYSFFHAFLILCVVSTDSLFLGKMVVGGRYRFCQTWTEIFLRHLRFDFYWDLAID